MTELKTTTTKKKTFVVSGLRYDALCLKKNTVEMMSIFCIKINIKGQSKLLKGKIVGQTFPWRYDTF